MAAYRGSLYVIGGGVNGQATDRVEIFDPASGRWSEGPRFPLPVYWAVAAEFDGRLFVAAGRDAGHRNLTQVYSWDGRRWVEEGPLPSPRFGLALAAARGGLYAIGGEDESKGPLAEALRYDPARRLWRAIRSLPEGRYGARAVALGGRLFVIGGAPTPRLAEVYEYDVAADRWLARAPLAVGRHSPAVGVLDGKIVVAAGASARGHGVEDTVEVYDPAADAWRFAAPLPEPRHAADGAVLDGTLYVAGGMDTIGPELGVAALRGGRWLASAQTPAAAPQRPARRAAVDAPARALRAGRDEDFALIVGVESYRSLPPADHAERDAELMARYAAALGVPEQNVVLLTGSRASKSDLEKYLDEWLPRNVEKTSRVFVFFSGHGAPEPADGEAFLVPWDGDASFLRSSAYPVSRFLDKLAALDAEQIVVALDACFSGAGGRSVIAKGLRPLVNVADPTRRAPKNLVIFTAAAADQVGGSDETLGHGLFTYHFSRGLSGEADADRDGHLTVAELDGYVRERVARAARRQNREQTTQLKARDPSARLY